MARNRPMTKLIRTVKSDHSMVQMKTPKKGFLYFSVFIILR